MVMILGTHKFYRNQRQQPLSHPKGAFSEPHQTAAAGHCKLQVAHIFKRTCFRILDRASRYPLIPQTSPENKWCLPISQPIFCNSQFTLVTPWTRLWLVANTLISSVQRLNWPNFPNWS